MADAENITQDESLRHLDRLDFTGIKISADKQAFRAFNI